MQGSSADLLSPDFNRFSDIDCIRIDTRITLYQLSNAAIGEKVNKYLCLGQLTVNVDDWTIISTDRCPEYNKKGTKEAKADQDLLMPS